MLQMLHVWGKLCKEDKAVSDFLIPGDNFNF